MLRMTTLVAMLIAVMAAPAAAVLELRLFDPLLTESHAHFDLRFFGELADNGQAPAPDPTEGFGSNDWRIGVGGAVISTLDRTTLFGHVPAGDPLWSMTLGVDIDIFDQNRDGEYDGVEALIVSLGGQHIDGPHPDDVDPHVLPVFRGLEDDADQGRLIRKTIASTKRHLNSAGQDREDKWAVKFAFLIWGEGFPLVVPGGFLQGRPNVHITAKHHQSELVPIGAPATEAEAGVFYDADNNRLSISPRSTTPGNGTSGQSAGLLTQNDFTGDPFFGSFIAFPPVDYLGFNPATGLHEFGDGTIGFIPDFGAATPATYQFQAAFDQMFFDPATDTLFALLSSLSHSDRPGEAGYSHFLEALLDSTLFSADSFGIGLRLQADLDGLTNNFTQDAFVFGEGVSLQIGNALIPEPASATIMLGLTFGLLCRMRRR